MKILWKINLLLAKSPMVHMSTIACFWSLFRLTIYWLAIEEHGRFSWFDLPIISSPVSRQWNMALTISLITLIGVATAIIGIAKKEKHWRWSFVTILLNAVAWWWMSSLTNSAFNPPPGVDF